MNYFHGAAPIDITTNQTIMTAIARLIFRPSPGRMDDFREAYDLHLAPHLPRLGLTPATASNQPLVVGIFSQLIEIECASALMTISRALQKDRAWQAALDKLRPILTDFDPMQKTLYQCEIYTTTAGAGQVSLVGAGTRQGLWQSFAIADGVPSCISAMQQDRHGHLWLGTGWLKSGSEWGACRYDGSQLWRFTTADGLVNDRVRAIVEDRLGRLWFGTFGGGISCYDGARFQSYTTADGLSSNDVLSLLEDREGHIWIGTLDGLDRWDGQRFTTFTAADGLSETYFMQDGAPRIGVSSLLQDRQGRIWAGTWGGLSYWDDRRFATYTQADGLANNWVRDVLEDRQGNIWAATGLWESGKKTNEEKGGLSRWDGQRFETYTTKDGLPDSMMRCLAEDRQGRIWVGTWGGGASCWDGEKFTTHTTADGLGDNAIFSLLEDRHGYLWLGTLAGGLSRCDQIQTSYFTVADGLPHNFIGSVVADRGGHLWFTAPNGLSRFDGTRFESIAALTGQMISALCIDRRDRLWLGTNGDGILCYDGDKIDRFTIFDPQLHNGIRAIIEDRRGHLWAATNRGLGRYDGSEWILFATAGDLPHRDVRALLEDRQGRIWAATDGGVCYYDGATWSAITIDQGLPRNEVIALLEDRDGRLWFGMDGGGVSCWDGGNIASYNIADGLCHNQVSTILQDRDGSIWFGTLGGGISRFDGTVFQTFMRKDGLSSDVVHCLHQDRDGSIWITTTDGITRYRPAQLPPQVQLTQAIADRRYAPDEAIRIETSQQVVLFEFRGKSWITPAERMAYVCRLKGHDSVWQPVYNGRMEYHNLPEGEYAFQVKAVDRDLNYSASAETSLTVEANRQLESWKEALSASGSISEFIGTSASIKKVQTQLAQVAPTDVTVLILGETGTGKGLAARALHGFSRHSAGPFLSVNCGGLPPGLVESELFGHEQGAFTGATRRKLGKVELAEGGTLFLDEIGDLPLEAQVKLLRLLEERTFERVGGTRTLTAQMRIIAATNRNLEQMLAEGTFREDLYFRLQSFTVRLPPLCERRQDIPLLAKYFMGGMASHLHKDVKHLSAEALKALQDYDWPGNVRELEHIINRAVIVCAGENIKLEDLALDVGDVPNTSDEALVSPEEYEQRYILHLLERSNWVIRGPNGAAALWGVPEGTLRSRMKRHGIERPEG